MPSTRGASSYEVKGGVWQGLSAQNRSRRSAPDVPGEIPVCLSPEGFSLLATHFFATWRLLPPPPSFFCKGRSNHAPPTPFISPSPSIVRTSSTRRRPAALARTSRWSQRGLQAPPELRARRPSRPRNTHPRGAHNALAIPSPDPTRRTALYEDTNRDKIVTAVAGIDEHTRAIVVSAAIFVDSPPHCATSSTSHHHQRVGQRHDVRRPRQHVRQDERRIAVVVPCGGIAWELDVRHRGTSRSIANDWRVELRCSWEPSSSASAGAA